MNKFNKIAIVDRGSGTETHLAVNGQELKHVVSYRVERCGHSNLCHVSFTVLADDVRLLGAFGAHPAHPATQEEGSRDH